MKTQKQVRQSTKTVQVLVTYTFKHTNRVCFTVRASNGTDQYNTCFDNGNASCTCDGFAAYHKECYHIKQLRPRYEAIMVGVEASEQERAADAVAHAEAKSEAKMASFQQGMDEQYASDPRTSVAIRSCEDWSSVDAPMYCTVDEAKDSTFEQLKARYDVRTTTSNQRQQAPLQRQGFSLMR